MGQVDPNPVWETGGGMHLAKEAAHPGQAANLSRTELFQQAWVLIHYYCDKIVFRD